MTMTDPGPRFSELVVGGLYGVGRIGDPVEWIDRRLGEETWSKQREILASVQRHRRTAVRSCHGTGKSHIASRAVAWWLDTHPAGDAFAVTTAPTFAQVRAILWRYIGQAHRKGKLQGRVNQTEWHIGDELVGFGRKPSDYDDDAFQGIHAPKVLVVIDEACGVPEQLWVAVDALLTNDDCHVLAIGNPDDPTSHFARVCEPGSGWNTIKIAAEDTPNFTGEPVSAELRRSLVSKTWVEDMKRAWGEDSPLYISKVLAEFPEDAEDGVIPSSQIATLRAMEHEPVDEDAETDVQLGVDVGAGGDYSVIRERRGNRVGRVWRSKHADSMRLVGEIILAVNTTGAHTVCIDVGGIGWGVKGRLEESLRELGVPCDVVGINFGEAASTAEARKRLENRRAELWWDVGRGLTVDGAWDLTNLDDKTAGDLVAPKWSLTSRGRIKVESKDEIIKRLGRSPDDGDALLLAFYRPRVRAVIRKPSVLTAPITSGSPGMLSAPR